MVLPRHEQAAAFAAQGVETLIKNLAAELELNMALSGVNKATDLGPGLFQHRFGKV